MKIHVNNQIFELEKEKNLLEVVSRMIPDSKHLIVELNGKIVRQEQWGQQALSEDDRLEVIQMVGGG